MAALTANSWTAVVLTRKIASGTRITTGTLEIPGADTYPTGGIPLPTIDKFGMLRNLDSLILFGHDSLTTGMAVSWDKANHKLQIYGDRAAGADDALAETPNTDVPGPRTWQFEAKGW